MFWKQELVIKCLAFLLLVKISLQHCEESNQNIAWIIHETNEISASLPSVSKRMWDWPWLSEDANLVAFRLYFVCLFVWSLSSHSRIFQSYGDVTIAGEGLQILTYAWHSWPSSSGGPFIIVISEDPWHSHLLPSVWQCSCMSLPVFLRLRSVATEDRTPISRMRGARSTSKPPRRSTYSQTSCTCKIGCDIDYWTPCEDKPLCIYTHVYLYVYVHVKVHVYVHVYIHVYVHMYIGNEQTIKSSFPQLHLITMKIKKPFSFKTRLYFLFYFFPAKLRKI